MNDIRYFIRLSADCFLSGEEIFQCFIQALIGGFQDRFFRVYYEINPGGVLSSFIKILIASRKSRLALFFLTADLLILLETIIP